MKLYNTLTRKQEEFKPIKKGHASMYTCGPTVYNYPHIGNYRAYIVADLVKRYLKYNGFKVKHIMNLTDVDDKTIKGSKAEGVSLSEFTKKFIDGFFDDLKELNIDPADTYPRATEHIKDMVALVENLMKKGLAYKGDDNSIYFDISKYKDYGKLAHLKLENLKAGARVKHDEYEKDSANDFALWKAWDKEDGDVFWETSIGKGRPGWHIECSAMSMDKLGNTFDIHTGGIDLIFPHHENEIAQSEAATGKPFVNYWLHNEWLLVEGKKMSKSLGNFYTLKDVFSKGYSPKAIRYLLLSTHYRQQLNFTFKGLEAAASSIQRLNDFIAAVMHAKGKEIDISKTIEKTQADFEKAMDDDLNISIALSHVFDFVRDINRLIAKDELGKKEAKKVIEFMKKLDEILGIMDFSEDSLDKDIDDLVKQREEARKNKNWAEADKIRDLLKEKNIILEDSKDGVRWKRGV
ncbi:MAG: cysteine--tRNA ligase [bacterium]|nr:cysteine--tRNA ligase [bacterium]